MKKRKLLVESPLDIIYIIGSFCEKKEFLNFLHLNKNIRQYIFYDNNPSNNIEFKFHRFPTEPLNYVKKLVIRKKTISYFEYIKSNEKVFRYFPNLKSLFIEIGTDFYSTTNYFFFNILPLDKNIEELKLIGTKFLVSNKLNANDIMTTNLKRLYIKNINISNFFDFQNLKDVKLDYLKLKKVRFRELNFLNENIKHLRLDMSHVCDKKILNKNLSQLKSLSCLRKLSLTVYGINENIYIYLIHLNLEYVKICYNLSFLDNVKKFLKLMIHNFELQTKELKEFRLKLKKYKKEVSIGKEIFIFYKDKLRNKYKKKFEEIKKGKIDESREMVISSIKSKLEDMKLFYLLLNPYNNIYYELK